MAKRKKKTMTQLGKQPLRHCFFLNPYEGMRFCPNLGMQGYSLVHPQTARFANIPDEVVYAFL